MSNAILHEASQEGALARLELLIDVHCAPDASAPSDQAGGKSRADSAWDTYCSRWLRSDKHLIRYEDAVERLARMSASHVRGASGRRADLLSIIKSAVPPVQPGQPASQERYGPQLSPELPVRNMLDCKMTPSGAIVKPTMSNAEIILANDSRWSGRFVFNELSASEDLDGVPVDDVHVNEIQVWITRNYGADIAPRSVRGAIDMVCKANPVHPVRDWLIGLKWDGVPRLDMMAETHLNARPPEAQMDARYQHLVRVMVAKWMISAVARAMRPGCHVKPALLLIGEQNSLKSRASSVLGGAWYSRTKIDLHNKDGMAQVGGVWIYEIPEISGLFRSRSAEEIKAFMDQSDDRFRSHYRMTVTRHPRTCVFIATDNHITLLQDPSGATRWLPIVVGLIPIDKLREDREQLWAEAVRRYHDGVSWELTPEEWKVHATYVQSFALIDAFEETVLEFLQTRPTGFSTKDLLVKCQVDLTRPGTGQLEAKVAAILTAAGYVQKRVNADGSRLRRWVRG